MKINNQITQSGLGWLIVAQLAVLAAFTNELSYWLVPVFLFSAAWRFRILKGHWSLPGWQVKGFGVFLSILGLLLSDINPLSLEAATTLLLLGFSLKNLELNHRRDGIVVVYIGYFLVATRFLYSQSLLTTAYAVLLMVVLTACLVSLHQHRSHQWRQNLKLSSSMLLLCMPLMLVGYLFFPRLPPIWSVPMPDNKAISGVTDFMSPGDISDIAKSGALAFRATFEGEVPRPVDRYWRGPVLTQFDGRSWSPAQEFFKKNLLLPDRLDTDLAVLFDTNIDTTGPYEAYRVIYEPNYQHWLFSLTPSVSLGADVESTFDYQMLSSQKVTSPLQVSYRKYSSDNLQLELPEWVRQQSTQVPAGLNPRTQSFVAQMKLSSKTDTELALNILKKFQDEPYFYSLRPGQLTGEDQIDQFLFESRKGFCAHFASAFTQMMRMAGLPARVVTGYQGGEWNEAGQFLAVHQFDAHAWVEVWFEGQGWILLDPTAWVAPSRIEQSSRDALAGTEGFLSDSLIDQLQFSMFNQLRLKFGAWQHQWQRWVLNYDSDDQFQLMSQLFGDMNLSRMLWTAGGFITVLGVLWLAVLGLFKAEDPSTLQYRQWQVLRRKLRTKGIDIEATTTPLMLGQMLEDRNDIWVKPLLDYLNILNHSLYETKLDSKQLRSGFNLVKRML